MSEIVVRHAEPNDAEALHLIYMQPETYADTLQIPHPSLALWKERLSKTPPGIQQLVACIDGVVVGNLTLEVFQRARRRHCATFGISVDCRHRGKGVASALVQEMVTLCDNWLSVDRIELTVFADNANAIRLYSRFGFEKEGLARRFAVRHGKQIDALYMARLKP